MKGKRFVIVLVLIALSLCGCNRLKKGQTYNLNDWWVNRYGDSLSISVKEVSSSEGIFVIKNNTDRVMMYGNDFYIQEYRDDKWYFRDYMPDDSDPYHAYTVTAEGYLVMPGEEAEIECNWVKMHMYDPLPPGKYRLVKYFFDEGTPDTYWEDNFPTPEYYIACEFEITK